MKRGFLQTFLFLILLLNSVANAATAPGQWADSAQKAYDNEEFEKALSYYRSIEQDFRSPSLYYNMGNAAFRAGELGKAVLFFQKARKMAPWDEDIHHNLELVQKEVQDEFEQEDPKTLSDGFKEFVVAAPLGDWWRIALFFSLLLGATLVLLTFADRSWRNILLSVVLLFLFLGGLAYGADRWKERILKRNGHLVVLSPSVRVQHEPTSDSSTAFILHEGSTVELRKERDGWLELRTPDEQIGWIPSDEVGKF